MPFMDEEIVVSRGFLTDLKELLEDELEANGPCEHEVNVCVCTLTSMLESTEAYLNKEEES